MEQRLLSATAARQICGSVSDMTLWRWLNDKDIGFPSPIYVGRRRYFRAAEITSWIEARAALSQK